MMYMLHDMYSTDWSLEEAGSFVNAKVRASLFFLAISSKSHILESESESALLAKYAYTYKEFDSGFKIR